MSLCASGLTKPSHRVAEDGEVHTGGDPGPLLRAAHTLAGHPGHLQEGDGQEGLEESLV